jgi:hypothetical protein
MIGMIIGSTVGAYIPSLWGAGIFSMESILGSLLFGILGIWGAYKIAQRL